METAREAFELGDFGAVRRLVTASDEDAALRRATSVDPVHAAVLAICFLGVVAIVVHYGL